MDRFEIFATTIAQINRCVQKIKSNEMSVLGLKGAHVMCLYSLGKEPEGLTAAQLCQLSGEDKAAMSRAVNELSEKGYVRLDIGTDKRAYRAKITLTAQGREVIAYMNRRVDHVLDVVGGALEERRRSEFYAALAMIAENLQSYVETEDLDRGDG